MGYAKTELAGKKYNATGACFITPGASDEGTFTLANVTPTAYDWESDQLFVMNPDDSSADAQLIYMDETTASGMGVPAGWYDFQTAAPCSDIAWSFGTGFMTSFGSGTPDFNYAGEVLDQAYSVDCRGKKYSIVPNGLPRIVSMSEISATGYDWESDQLFIMNPEDSSADVQLVYMDETVASGMGVDAGWYDFQTAASYADYTVAPGSGFMTSFGSGGVILNFPKASTNN